MRLPRIRATPKLFHKRRLLHARSLVLARSPRFRTGAHLVRPIPYACQVKWRPWRHPSHHPPPHPRETCPHILFEAPPLRTAPPNAAPVEEAQYTTTSGRWRCSDTLGSAGWQGEGNPQTCAQNISYNGVPVSTLYMFAISLLPFVAQVSMLAAGAVSRFRGVKPGTPALSGEGVAGRRVNRSYARQIRKPQASAHPAWAWLRRCPAPRRDAKLRLHHVVAQTYVQNRPRDNAKRTCQRSAICIWWPRSKKSGCGKWTLGPPYRRNTRWYRYWGLARNSSVRTILVAPFISLRKLCR